MLGANELLVVPSRLIQRALDPISHDTHCKHKLWSLLFVESRDLNGVRYARGVPSRTPSP